MPKKPRVLIDMDGVVVDLLPTFLGRVNAELGTSFTIESFTEFDFSSLGISHRVIDAVFDTPDFFTWLKPIPGAIDMVWDLQGRGGRCIYSDQSRKKRQSRGGKGCKAKQIYAIRGLQTSHIYIG